MRVCIDGVFGEISTLPGNSQIAISHAVYVPKELRGKGLGTSSHEKRLQALRELGYDYVLCTVRSDNEAQQAVLNKFSWTKLDEFKSSRNDETIFLYGKILT